MEFQKTGGIVLRSLRAKRSNVEGVCPETHFWCPDKEYCLPVFVRCNNIFDCPGHEDEEGCDEYTCPGFYRCRSSKVCMHVTHVCDGWPLCPQWDDELWCSLGCPVGCECHGRAFFCTSLFQAHLFRKLRYLDVRGIGMNVHHLHKNDMLIHLSLARCGVSDVNNFTFYNLQSLDLSDNLLAEVSAHHFKTMPQLTVLFLGGNPLTSVFSTITGSSTELGKVHTLDLSRVKMYSVDLSLFTIFPHLHVLNLSQSGVTLFHWNSSQIPVLPLQKLDLRGCTMSDFAKDVLKEFIHLQLLFADNFKFCCLSVLPPGFDLNHCHAKPDDVSSCDNLLGSLTYQITVIVLATLALIGNVGSLTVRVFVKNTWQLSRGSVVLTHLSVADLGMGLYLTTLGLADRLLIGHYAVQDESWRRGAVCQLAGFLALSCRLSATAFLTILFLDRFLLRCPFLITCFTSAKVKVICFTVWASSFPLAAMPLILRWRLFGQQALCVPSPHTGDSSLDYKYAYDVMVVCHFSMFVMCCLLEIVSGVSLKVSKSGLMTRDPCPKDFQFFLLGSLGSGFVYTVSCLVPTDSFTDRQKAKYTALVYFGSVVSSALNPYLHLYGVRVERRKRIKETRLLKIINRTRV